MDVSVEDDQVRIGFVILSLNSFFASQPLRDAQNVATSVAPSDALNAVESHAPGEDDRGRTEQRAPVPEDPFWGPYPAMPAGQRMNEFCMGQHRVTKDAIQQNTAIRDYIVWELQEATFRFQLRDLDVRILKSSHGWSEDVAAARKEIWSQCWGAESFVPTGEEPPPLTDTDFARRGQALLHLYKLVRAWPRANEIFDVSTIARSRAGLTEHNSQGFEQSVWKFYTQSFFDYFGIMPCLPTIMPPNPFAPPVVTPPAPAPAPSSSMSVT